MFSFFLTVGFFALLLFILSKISPDTGSGDASMDLDEDTTLNSSFPKNDVDPLAAGMAITALTEIQSGIDIYPSTGLPMMDDLNDIQSTPFGMNEMHSDDLNNNIGMDTFDTSSTFDTFDSFDTSDPFN